jgi:hypothetical protein
VRMGGLMNEQVDIKQFKVLIAALYNKIKE